ncbi:hypothetical protein DFH29DRAFT_20593 [Suillus ampliporus]|nr:hypothetical protein DFH29DRAFT_20593 [Suillus ampliporus]
MSFVLDPCRRCTFSGCVLLLFWLRSHWIAYFASKEVWCSIILLWLRSITHGVKTCYKASCLCLLYPHRLIRCSSNVQILGYLRSKERLSLTPKWHIGRTSGRQGCISPSLVMTKNLNYLCCINATLPTASYRFFLRSDKTGNTNAVSTDFVRLDLLSHMSSYGPSANNKVIVSEFSEGE